VSTEIGPERSIQRLLAGAVVHHEALAERIGINPTDLKCLLLVAGRPGMTPTRLAELAGITSGAVTGVLDRLERGGHVRREPDPSDRRSVLVAIEEQHALDLAALYAPLSARVGTETSHAVIDRMAAALHADTERLRVAARGGLVGDTYHAPLGDATRGRLVFASGAPRLSLSAFALGQHARMVVEASASRLRLGGGTQVGELVRARFEGPPPDIRTGAGTITIRYRRRTLDFRSRAAEIALNPDIPWSIEIDGGVTDLKADLRNLQLDGLQVRGGANQMSLELPAPQGTIRIGIDGGASGITLRRPPRTAASLRVLGGASRLRLDDRRHGSVGNDFVVRSEGFESASDRYEIVVRGGASDLVVATRR
jgi:DNA-binding MarR family transcriptional regulator